MRNENVEKSAPVSFVKRTPETDPDESKRGKINGRWALCPDCGKKIAQFIVAPEWLDNLRPASRASFLEACSRDSEGNAYLPTRCTKHERARLA